MTPAEVLLAVRNLLCQPENWTKDTFARLEDDRKVSISHPRAFKFSLGGALYRVHWITRSAGCYAAHHFLRKAIDPSATISLESFNDARGTTHYTIVQLIDRAIRLSGGIPPSMEVEE